MFAFRNSSADTITNVKFWFELLDTDLYTLQLGLIAPGVDECDDPIFEAITSNKLLPVGITFVDADSEPNAVTHASLAAEGYIGLWVKQTLAVGASDTFNSCDALYTAFGDPQADEAKTDFPFKLHIMYDTP